MSSFLPNRDELGRVCGRKQAVRTRAARERERHIGLPQAGDVDLALHERVASERDKQGVGFSCIAILALAGTVGGCGADAAGASEGAGVERAAFTSIKGDVGFVLSTLVTAGTVTGDPNYSFNSAGGTNSITHLAGTGQYRVDMPNLGSTIGGHIEVTPFGNGAKYCKVVNWLSSGSTLQAFVNCFNSFSSATESAFFLTYNRRSDTPGAEGAYVWAFDASSAS
jgi:hypothetical protein